MSSNNTFNPDVAVAVKETAENAAKYSIENMQYKKDMALAKKQFLSILKEVDPAIFDMEEKDSDEYRLKQHYSSSFVIVKKVLNSLEKYEQHKDTKNLLDKFVGQFLVTLSVLKYIGKLELVEPYLQKYGLTEFSLKGLDEKYKDLQREDIKATLTDCFNDAELLTRKVDNNLDIIKNTEFDKIPAEAKYEKSSNQTGITPTDFANIVNIEAVAQVKAKKAKEKVEKMKNKNYNKQMSNMLIEHISTEIVKDIE